MIRRLLVRIVARQRQRLAETIVVAGQRLNHHQPGIGEVEQLHQSRVATLQGTAYFQPMVVKKGKKDSLLP